MEKRKIRFRILIVGFLFISSISVSQEKLSIGFEKKIDSIFNDYSGNPGCAIAVVKNGETLYQKGYGLANLEYGIPVTTETVFDANAMAKQITAVCIFMLEEEGKLNINDPLQKFFPEFPEYTEGAITVKNLLYQTSGIRDYLAILYSQNKYYGDKVDNHDVLKLLMNQQNPNYKPGTEYADSNSNYALLANIIEKVSGQKLPDYAIEKLFNPLNMTNTFFVDSPNKIIKNRAIGYQQDGDNFVINHFFNSSVVGSGGLQSNLEDIVKWNNNLSIGIEGGKDLVTKMITPETLNSGAQSTYAGGLYNQNHYDIAGLPTVRQSGQWAGFRSLYYKFLKQDVTFIILSNNANTNVWGLLDELIPLFLEEEITEAQETASQNNSESLKEVTLRTNQMQKFVGSYYNIFNGNVRHIELRNDSLLYKRSPNASGTELVPVSKTEVIFKVAPQLKFAFDAQDYKTMTLTFNERDPEGFKKYENYAHSKEELKEYELNYYNEDCDVVYQISTYENGLRIVIDNEELVLLTSMARDMFREEHFGYIKFSRDRAGSVNGFMRQDNTFTNLKFHKIEKMKS